MSKHNDNNTWRDDGFQLWISVAWNAFRITRSVARQTRIVTWIAGQQDPS